MSYSTGDAAILAILRTVSTFSTGNTASANWLLLNSGASDHYGIIRPGEFAVEWISPTTYLAHWHTVIEIWQKFTDPNSTPGNLYGHVNNVINAFMPERLLNLGASISNADITGGNVPEEMWLSGGGPQWLRWSLNLAWDEEVIVTYTD